VWQQELDFQYQELGQALSELTELEEDEEWKIDQPVYQVACHVASELMAFSFPAPTIFTHGPKSVVFNWESDNTNLYLTVSADHMSVLASSPERIKRRLELPKELLNQQKLLPAIQALHSNQPVFATDSSITNPHRFPY